MCWASGKKKLREERCGGRMFGDHKLVGLS